MKSVYSWCKKNNKIRLIPAKKSKNTKNPSNIDISRKNCRVLKHKAKRKIVEYFKIWN